MSAFRKTSNYLLHIFEKIGEVASKWPQRSKIASFLHYLASITYVTKFQGIFIGQKMTFTG